MLPELPSIADAQTMMSRGELRPIDLVEHCLGRIQQFEDQIHAWVMVDEEGARNEARRLGKMLDDGEEPVGPLHGIPIGIKDIIDVAGWPTLCGSKLREGHVAEKDAAVVGSLRKAGAIILGKTVTTEWASFDPPPTRNPWNLNHTPGGSSSGSAAAVAMEMCVAALGTQTGGSIIRPASYCGVVGLKLYPQLTKMDGVFPFSLHLDHVGPITRNVADAWTVPKAFTDGYHEPRISLPSSIPKRLYLLEGELLEKQDEETRIHFEELRTRLAEQIEVRSFQLPDFVQQVPAMHRRIMAVEGAEVHRADFENYPASFSPQIRNLIEEGRQTPVLDYAEAIRLQASIKRNLGKEEDGNFHRGFWRGTPRDNFLVFAMPATPTPAPDWSTTGNPVFNSLWSFLGIPSMTIPSGLNSAGLPFGLQLITVSGLIPYLIEMSTLCERVVRFKDRPRLLNQ